MWNVKSRPATCVRGGTDRGPCLPRVTLLRFMLRKHLTPSLRPLAEHLPRLARHVAVLGSPQVQVPAHPLGPMLGEASLSRPTWPRPRALREALHLGAAEARQTLLASSPCSGPSDLDLGPARTPESPTPSPRGRWPCRENLLR